MNITMANNKGLHKYLLPMLKTIILPIIVWAIMEYLDMKIAGQHVLGSTADIKTLLRNWVASFAFALAISSNLFCGRMDLSLGAQMYAGVIIGGNLALKLNLGGVGILFMAMIVGGICGGVIGTMFIHMRILPMVLGLGMTLVFECICFPVNNQQGITIYGKPNVSILSDAGFIIAVLMGMLLITTFIFQYLTFGYHLRAVQGNQKLAGDAGINIFKNCVICYVLAGVLAACAGVFEAAFSGSMSPVMGMTSNGTVFINMFPMMLGMWIGSFSQNRQLGFLMGSLSVRMLVLGLSKLSLDINVQNMIIYTLFLLFSIYSANKDKISQARIRAKRLSLARETIAMAHQKG